MRKYCLLFLILLIFISLDAKPRKKRGSKKLPKYLDELIVTPQNFITSYKDAYTQYFDLLNTKLDIKPIFKDKTLEGKAELLLRPHFYNQNTLVLDAKYMNIHSVSLKTPKKNEALKYTYDTLKLTINLDRTYTMLEQLSIIINYTATPYLQDSTQIIDGRGMYFIDVEDKNPYKPMHLWTQGEEESASCWFPTIDATNQKTSQEILVTIDSNLISLSNGLLVETHYNGDGTKTDHWLQNKPHAPYLFFLSVGDFYKHQTTWRDKEVSAYTFPKYKDGVAEIFKNLPEMMEFYSQKLGVDFPWDKLSNIMAYDYTAGAMENSSAIIYYDNLLCDKRQLIDGNFDWIISHELGHQWFGDYVTPESWANLTLSESFADYAEYIWMEYKYGKDLAEAYRIQATQKYLNSSSYRNNPIINYYYETPHDLFDDIRYEKGGAVLHLLRNYVGDEAFFTALNKYLKEHRFGIAELSDLRKAFEAVTGKDLNWFFNQWWLEKGHPILDISHRYDEKNKTIELTVHQTQTSSEAPIFRIPTKVDIYTNGKIETKIIDINDKINTFYFPASTAPQWVNFDADKVLICEKTEDLSDTENIFKFYNASKIKDKLEVLEILSNKIKGNEAVQDVFYQAFQLKNEFLRQNAIELIDIEKFSNKAKLSLALQNIVNTDTASKVRDRALQKLAKIEKEKIVSICEYIIQKDSSYRMLTTALNLLRTYHFSKAYQYAVQNTHLENRDVIRVICNIFKDTTVDNFEYFQKAIWLNSPYNFSSNFRAFEKYLENASIAQVEKGVLFLKDIYQYEEADFNKNTAKQVVNNLYYYFLEKGKKDKSADIKLQVIKKYGTSNW
jgi:aminopeptidase N